MEDISTKCLYCGKPVIGSSLCLECAMKDKIYERIVDEQSGSDQVNSPSHYQQFSLESIEIIKHTLGPERFKAYCEGCELKYRLRAGFKGDGNEDLAKAMKYNEFRSKTSE